MITRTGTWYSYIDTRLGQGKEAARTYLKEHPEVSEEIDGKVRALLQVGAANAESAEPEQEAKDS